MGLLPRRSRGSSGATAIGSTGWIMSKQTDIRDKLASAADDLRALAREETGGRAGELQLQAAYVDRLREAAETVLLADRWPVGKSGQGVERRA